MNDRKKDDKSASSRPSEGRRREAFPGGGATDDVPLRVSADRGPIADVLAHGAGNPEVEVCGVLVGSVLEDASGTWVQVRAAIRGQNAREQGAHVTFTQETWNHIHDELEKKHPGLSIVGWYHTHPGFGVFLSEMDSFIHRSFFGGPEQLSVVYDPLSGRLGFFVLRGGALAELPRYWRDGRAVELTVAGAEKDPAGGLSSSEVARLLRSIASLEESLQRALHRQWLTTLGVAGFLGLLMLLLAWPLVTASMTFRLVVESLVVQPGTPDPLLRARPARPWDSALPPGRDPYAPTPAPAAPDRGPEARP